MNFLANNVTFHTDEKHFLIGAINSVNSPTTIGTVDYDNVKFFASKNRIVEKNN